MMNALKNNVDRKEKCVACGLCINICPVNCIEMKQNAEGFYKPLVDEEKCIRCGKCAKECIINVSNETEEYKKKIYAATSIKKAERKNSSSGGIFYILAKWIIDNGGVVYGCGMDQDMLVRHTRVTDTKELFRILKSKYVQSYIMDVYENLEFDLKSGKKVLFSGTPCQVAAIKKQYKKYKNLYLVDIVCHGVTSPSFFKEHIRYLEKKHNSKIISFSFRNKTKKLGYIEKVEFDNKVIKQRKAFKSFYFASFLNMNSYNAYCYECKFSSMDRPGDVTLGDYHWGLKKHPNFEEIMDSPYDLSMLMINSEKGCSLLNSIEEDVYLEETDIEVILERNKNLQRPSIRPYDRDDFYDKLNRNGYEKCEKEYRHSKRYLRNIFPFRTILLIKNLLKNNR